MDIEKLSQKIKALRKIKCLSQEELAAQSGVSLRTVQRVENAESTPSGETLKRILKTLGTSYQTLVAETITKKPLKTLKGMFEYLHIFDDKLIINTSVTPDNVVKTYEKSISSLFKTLGVIFVGTLLFTIVGVVFFFLESPHLTIMATCLATTFLITAFLMVGFSSGIPYIERKQIVATKIEKMTMGNVNFIVIYRNGKRIKERGIAFSLNDLACIEQELLSENLLKNNKIVRNNDPLIALISIPVIFSLTTFFAKPEFFATIYAIYGLAGVVLITIKVIIKNIRNSKKYAHMGD